MGIRVCGQEGSEEDGQGCRCGLGARKSFSHRSQWHQDKGACYQRTRAKPLSLGLSLVPAEGPS